MPFTFPSQLFNPTSVKLAPVGASIQSPPSLSGVGQVLRTDGGGLWRIDYTGIVLRKHDQIRAWRAWEDELANGAMVVNVPVLDLRYAPRPLQGGSLARPGSLHSGSTLDPYFPEATNYGTPLIKATINAAALRATTITINVQQGSRVVGGQVFEVDHGGDVGKRVYRTGRVIGRNGQSTTIQISPPLHQAISATTSINFDWPCLACHLVPDSDISPDISFGRAGVSISFIEAF